MSFKLGDYVGVVDEAVEHRANDGVVAKTSPLRPNGL
jgi:hypothetical protein